MTQRLVSNFSFSWSKAESSAILQLLEKLVASSLSGLYSDGTISGGMIPKLGNDELSCLKTYFTSLDNTVPFDLTFIF